MLVSQVQVSRDLEKKKRWGHQDFPASEPGKNNQIRYRTLVTRLQSRWEKERGKQREREGEEKSEIKSVRDKDISEGGGSSYSICNGSQYIIRWQLNAELHNADYNKGYGWLITSLADMENLGGLLHCKYDYSHPGMCSWQQWQHFSTTDCEMHMIMLITLQTAC